MTHTAMSRLVMIIAVAMLVAPLPAAAKSVPHAETWAKTAPPHLDAERFFRDLALDGN